MCVAAAPAGSAEDSATALGWISTVAAGCLLSRRRSRCPSGLTAASTGAKWTPYASVSLKTTMAELATFEPDWLSPPGDTVADALEELGMSQADLARRTGFSKKHINGLIKGKVAITADAALRLEAVLGEPVSFWLQREAQYREALARRAAIDEAAAHKQWLRELPLHWMVEQGWVRRSSRKEGQVDECLRFFGVASVAAWRNTYVLPLAAFRALAKLAKQHGAVAAWLRRAEQQAGLLACASYDRRAFQSMLPELCGLAKEADPAAFAPKLQERCAACGVAVVLVAPPPGCAVHGATRWLTRDKAMLALSLRDEAGDQLWFSFFHQAAHVLKHGKKLLFVEGLDGLDRALEDEADRFAAQFVLPATPSRSHPRATRP